MDCLDRSFDMGLHDKLSYAMDWAHDGFQYHVLRLTVSCACAYLACYV